jgi:polar amino acid transport system permease protein
VGVFFQIIIDAFPALLRGAGMTVLVWVGAFVISVFVGCLWGLLRARQLRLPVFALICDAITLVLRGVPFYVQLLIAYFVLPSCTGLAISAYTAATISLGFCSAAYVSQIVRGGIDAIAPGQWEAAQVLGYTTVQAVWYILLPQAFRAVLPALGGEWDQLLKSTAVVSSIGLLELTGMARNSVSRTMEPLPIFLAIALMYLVLSGVLNGALALLSRRLKV